MCLDARCPHLTGWGTLASEIGDRPHFLKGTSMAHLRVVMFQDSGQILLAEIAKPLDRGDGCGIVGGMNARVETLKINASVGIVSRLGWISLFAALTGAAAWIRIPLPFTPIPITLQTLVVLASGVILGRDGFYAQLLYLFLGGIGLPLFASSWPGAIALFGPSGGYLIGFVAAAYVAGRAIHPRWAEMGYAKRGGALLLCSLLIFIPGVLQLAMVGNLSLGQALVLGFLPFLLGDLLKVAWVAATPRKLLR